MLPNKGEYIYSYIYWGSSIFKINSILPKIQITKIIVGLSLWLRRDKKRMRNYLSKGRPTVCPPFPHCWNSEQNEYFERTRDIGLSLIFFFTKKAACTAYTFLTLQFWKRFSWKFSRKTCSDRTDTYVCTHFHQKYLGTVLRNLENIRCKVAWKVTSYKKMFVYSHLWGRKLNKHLCFKQHICLCPYN